MDTRSTTAAELVDIGRALRRLAGDVDLLQEIVEIFLEAIPAQLDELDRLIAAGDTTEVANQAHDIQDGAANFCAGQVATAASALERQARSGSLGEAQALLRCLRHEFQALYVTLSGLDWRTIGAIPRC